MRCGVVTNCHNSSDWERVLAQDWSRPPAVPDHEIIDAAIELGDMAEPLGFDVLWTTEHFGTPYGMVPNALQFLAYWAGRTSRIDLGTMVVVLPWHHPLQVAHEVAMLDILLKGRRLTLGVGRGLSPKEFGPLGVPQEQARQRFDESIEIMRLAFAQERFSYDGQIFTIPETSLRPQPRHRDLLDGTVAAFMTQASGALAARAGLGQIVVGSQTFEVVGETTKSFNADRASAGLSADNQPIVYLFAYCAPTASAASKAYEYISLASLDGNNHYGLNDASYFANVAGYEHYGAIAERRQAHKKATSDTPHLVGTPDEIIAKIQRMQEMTSARELIVGFNFYGAMPRDEAKASMELFAREVLPAVQAMPTPFNTDAETTSR
jgi:alkanesulfonate monooxygenase SsuD/methylene tetrahydromethanopterin reductase-like flavin-dependent oxidoreductase (luciferase family)